MSEIKHQFDPEQVGSGDVQQFTRVEKPKLDTKKPLRLSIEKKLKLARGGLKLPQITERSVPIDEERERSRIQKRREKTAENVTHLKEKRAADIKNIQRNEFADHPMMVKFLRLEDIQKKLSAKDLSKEKRDELLSQKDKFQADFEKVFVRNFGVYEKLKDRSSADDVEKISQFEKLMEVLDLDEDYMDDILRRADGLEKNRSPLAEARSAERRREEYVTIAKRKKEKEDALVDVRNTIIEIDKKSPVVIDVDADSSGLVPGTRLDVQDIIDSDNDVSDETYFTPKGDRLIHIKSGVTENGNIARTTDSTRNLDMEDRAIKTEGISKEANVSNDDIEQSWFDNETGETPKYTVSDFLNKLKSDYGVTFNPDGTYPSGFLGQNKRRIKKLERTNPEFEKLTLDLINKIAEKENEESPKGHVAVRSHIDKSPKNSQPGRNVLTG